MYLTRLEVNHLRIIETAALQPAVGVNLLIGGNGSGIVIPDLIRDLLRWLSCYRCTHRKDVITQKRRMSTNPMFPMPDANLPDITTELT